MTTISVRYITDDVDAAVYFYAERLGFKVEMQPGPGFAVLSRGDLRLLLTQPGAGGAGQRMPDGRSSSSNRRAPEDRPREPDVNRRPNDAIHTQPHHQRPTA